MDNKAYLDEIAVKGKRKGAGGPILSPTVIKLIIVAVFAVIALAIVGNMISSKNAETVKLYESVYSRVSALADKKGPFSAYQNKLNSSELRAYNISTRSSLETTLSTLSSAAKGVNLNVSSISSDVKTKEKGIVNQFNSSLENARLLGTLDETFASEAAYHLSLLISLEREARAKVTDANFAAALDASIADLTVIQENYADWPPIASD